VDLFASEQYSALKEVGDIYKVASICHAGSFLGCTWTNITNQDVEVAFGGRG